MCFTVIFQSNCAFTSHTFLTGKLIYFKHSLPDADALMNPTKRLKDEETGVFNEILKASNQEEIIHKDLKQTTTTKKTSVFE